MKAIILLILILSSLFYLGNLDRAYSDKGITCYLGYLYPGAPVYFCMNPDGSMDHSWMSYQKTEMDMYYRTGGVTRTLTVV